MFGKESKKSSVKVEELEKQIALLESENTELRARITHYESEYDQNQRTEQEN